MSYQSYHVNRYVYSSHEILYKDFQQNLGSILARLDKKSIIIVDFNIDVSKHSNSSPVCQSLMNRFYFKRLNNLPTRIYLNSKSLLEHIYISR